jgi:pSer/pThr/pTyr-binding forkhead associated (FHA) protein
MRVILQVTAGPSEGRQIPLQVGEVARFGRSTTADVCFPDDPQMAPVQFQLECLIDRCLLRNLSNGFGTLLNDQPVNEADLNSGDTILAGRTRFATIIEGGTGNPSEDSGATTDETSTVEKAPAKKPLSLPELCGLLEIDEESQQLLQPEHTIPSLIATFVEHQKFDAAIRLLSYSLPKREAIWWAYRCVDQLLGNGLSKVEQAIMDAALAWLKEPSEPHRRTAMELAEGDDLQSAASWVALAAFWSEGSLAPPDLPEVPPDDRLTSQGVTAALLLTANQGDFSQSTQKYQSILKMGQAIQAGEVPLPMADQALAPTTA